MTFTSYARRVHRLHCSFVWLSLWLVGVIISFFVGDLYYKIALRIFPGIFVVFPFVLYVVLTLLSPAEQVTVEEDCIKFRASEDDTEQLYFCEIDKVVVTSRPYDRHTRNVGFFGGDGRVPLYIFSPLWFLLLGVGIVSKAVAAVWSGGSFSRYKDDVVVIVLGTGMKAVWTPDKAKTASLVETLRTKAEEHGFEMHNSLYFLPISFD